MCRQAGQSLFYSCGRGFKTADAQIFTFLDRWSFVARGPALAIILPPLTS